MKKVILVNCFVVVSMLLTCSLTYAVLSPTTQLRPTLEEISSILSDPAMKGKEKKYERRELIMHAVKERFDFRMMSKYVLGKTVWNEITPAEQDHFQTIFTKLLENAYLDKLEVYSGVNVRFVKEVLKKNRAMVSTMVGSEGAGLPVNYIMMNIKENWMVYDIRIENVSLMKNYKQQFRSVLKREQFEGLVKHLEKKNKSLEQGTGK